MTRSGIAAAAALATVLCVSSAWAGRKFAAPVTINSTQQWAAGSLGSARNSIDTVQYIVCSVVSSSTPGGDLAFCTARRSDGAMATCTTTKANMLAGARAISSQAYINFGWDDEGECTYLQIRNSSEYEPKQ